MTDFNTSDSSDTTPVSEAPVTGQADELGEQADQVTEVDFDVEAFGDQFATVKVNGEDVRVPVKEALMGYQRQADYTRGKQQLAQATALQNALETNPEATIELLQRTYGKSAADAMVAQATPADDGFDPDDPVAQELRQVRAELDAIQQERTSRELDATLAGLAAKYGDDYNEQDLIDAARKANVQHPSELEGVYREMMFDKFYARASARDEHATASAADNAARVAAKSGLGAIVTSGNGVAPSSAAAPTPVIDSFEDAWAAAKATHGLSF